MADPDAPTVSPGDTAGERGPGAPEPTPSRPPRGLWSSGSPAADPLEAAFRDEQRAARPATNGGGRPTRPARPAPPDAAAPGPPTGEATAARTAGPGTPGARSRRPEPRAAAPAGPPGPPVPAPRGRKRRPNRKRRKAARRQRVPFWRGRVLPKSVLGISMVILALGVGAAASGVALYMYYQYRLETSDALIRTFDKRYETATKGLDAAAVNARAQIQSELEPLRKIAATGETLEALLAQTQPSVWSAWTFDDAGQPVVGAAFVVASDNEKSFLLTSYTVVKAATAQPGPKITVRKGDQQLPATLWTWQEDRDLALLIVDRGGLPRLEWAASGSTRLGDRVFAVSGLGSAGGAITQGFVVDVAASGLQHDAAIGTAFQGGPLVNSEGKVVAVASRTYSPLGFPSEGVYFAPAVTDACTKVLSCPGGTVTGAGAQQ